jgi:hypothetical protein
LIKDYELEVHYHPGKTNIVADVLSHKAHCNYLLVVRLTGQESSTRVLPNLSLFNITLTPTLRDEIKAAQKNDEGMDHFKRRMQEGDPKVACFHEDTEGTLWFKERLVVSKKEALKILPNYVELISKYDPQRGSIDHMTPHRLDQNYSNHPTPYHLVKRGSQNTCNRKHGCHDSCTLYKG